jgi:16S rRNA (cytidine1402-2'-O)-methyltransferase
MHHEMGKLYVVATPIGNLEDLSHRAQRILGQVTCIAAEDTRHSKGLLQHLGIMTPLISYHEHNEKERAHSFIEKLIGGEDIALISDAGTPLISDPGYALVAAAHSAGIQVIPIPGACAAITALSVSGLPTDKFLFEGFLPAKSGNRRKRLTSLAYFPHTLVFYEAPHRIVSMVEDCCEVLVQPRRATIAREITKKFESIKMGNLSEILSDLQTAKIPEKGEFVLVVEGFQEETQEAPNDHEMERVLQILLAELSLKQSVQIAVKLTGLPKNALYDCAMKLQGEGKNSL